MAQKEPINVLITGAAGQIGYSLIPLFATGLVFGMDQPINLRLMEINPAMRFLRGAVMEINDGAYPLVAKIELANAFKTGGVDPGIEMDDPDKLAEELAARQTDIGIDEAFTDVDYCVLVGGFPRGPGMVRAELLAKNAPIFQTAGRMLEQYGKVTTKVLVIANPANSNCLMCAMSAPKIPKRNFAALTRLDMNRARSQLASKLGVGCAAIKNVIIWGNHSATQVPDVNSGTVLIEGKEEPLADVLAADAENARWLAEEFVSKVQKRGKAIIDARGKSSAMSAANGVKDCLRDWVLGTPPGEHVAMAVYTEEGNPYGIAPGVFYSFPCVCENGDYRILGPDEGINVTDAVRTAMIASQDELLGEKADIDAMAQS